MLLLSSSLLLLLYICPDIMDHDYHLRDHSRHGLVTSDPPAGVSRHHQLRILMQKPALETADPKAMFLYEDLEAEIQLKSIWCFLMFLLHVGLAIYRIYRFDQLFRHRKTAFSVWNWEAFEHTRFNRVFVFIFLSWRLSTPKSFMFDRKYVPNSSIHGGILLVFPDLVSAGWGDSGELSLFRRHLAEGRGFKGWDIIPFWVDPDQDMIAHGNSQKNLFVWGEYYLGGP